MLALCAICSPQTDPKNVPQPPTAELRKFDPFLGKFQVSGDYSNLLWTGTLELKKVIKGWYIEQTIFVKTEGIDCLSSIILSPLNSNVKMSPHETGDIHVESEGTAASERNQRVPQGRLGGCQRRRTPFLERAPH